uniref:TRAP transporter small permease n=1 Tax=Caldisericum exile TaxID=693075 RepID=A0A7C4TZW5_9BACT
MERIYKSISIGERYISKVLEVSIMIVFVAMVFIVFLQIIAREFFRSLSWTEELTRYLLIYLTFFGAVLAYKNKRHIVVDFIVERMRGKKDFVYFLTTIISAIFFLAGIFYGFEFIVHSQYQRSPALQIPMQLLYFSIPLSFIFMLYYALLDILRFLTERGKRGENK